MGDGGLPFLLPGTGEWEFLLHCAADADLQPVGADANIVDGVVVYTIKATPNWRAERKLAIAEAVGAV